jgi:hypothetical protein
MGAIMRIRSLASLLPPTAEGGCAQQHAKSALAPLFAAALLGAATALSAADEPAAAVETVSLADLAHRSDLVVLAQARDTDYLRRRDIPVSGSAYLKALITYKADRAVDLVEVYEKGLHENACYFPDPTVFEEGRRYLLFLRRDPDHPQRFRGLPEGCAVDVLVASDNRYAVRVPVTGIRLADAVEDLAGPMVFSDPYAIVEDASLPPPLREAMRAAGQIASVEETAIEAGSKPTRRWRYAQGISLATFSALMHLEKL